MNTQLEQEVIHNFTSQGDFCPPYIPQKFYHLVFGPTGPLWGDAEARATPQQTPKMGGGAQIITENNGANNYEPEFRGEVGQNSTGQSC